MSRCKRKHTALYSKFETPFTRTNKMQAQAPAQVLACPTIFGTLFVTLFIGTVFRTLFLLFLGHFFELFGTLFWELLKGNLLSGEEKSPLSIYTYISICPIY